MSGTRIAENIPFNLLAQAKHWRTEGRNYYSRKLQAQANSSDYKLSHNQPVG
jgi:hypothetical protein